MISASSIRTRIRTRIRIRNSEPGVQHGTGGAKPRRRGLAPLEMVLCLPVLLFVMALLINIGNVACWKVRSLTAARHAMWRARSDPNPWPAAGDGSIPDWRPPARMGVSSSNPLQTVQQAWDRPQTQHPFAAGPIITGNGGKLRLNDGRLYDIVPMQLRQGTSFIQRQMPLLPGLGTFEFNIQHPLLDGAGQFQNMGYGHNHDRRSNGWYNIRQAPEWMQLAAVFQMVDQQMLTNPLKEDLKCVDRDDEFYAFYGSVPDFYPRIPVTQAAIQTLATNWDNQWVERTIVQPHIKQVQGARGGGKGGVPERMAKAFKKLYEAMLQAGMNVGGLPEKIQQLDRFIETLN